ncbi:spore cortex biosynthesis protein YabQ [Clostridium manihotivorum]|uniref:Spore cortex biosynthesis protein YabQ n=2 Tax=Clostridium manihotivorum TaxID=2320868 RepID=A0A410DNT1_9CLOT|nr:MULTISPECIES: spore cortex biosynthesis protein YabQ [Clostridium]QAA30741.1 spore cortex biosynthesis protein YabQ [Clostridium manihotivorum]
MLLPLKIQFEIVIFSLMAGLIAGILFDFYRIVRGFGAPKFIIFIEDFLFWVLNAIIIFTFLLYVNYAFLGMYVYLFIIIGALIYLNLFSDKLMKIERKAERVTGRGFRVIFKNLLYIFKSIFLRNKINK